MNKCERPQKGSQPFRSLHKVCSPPLHNGLLRNFAITIIYHIVCFVNMFMIFNDCVFVGFYLAPCYGHATMHRRLLFFGGESLGGRRAARR